ELRGLLPSHSQGSLETSLGCFARIWRRRLQQHFAMAAVELRFVPPLSRSLHSYKRLVDRIEGGANLSCISVRLCQEAEQVRGPVGGAGRPVRGQALPHLPECGID